MAEKRTESKLPPCGNPECGCATAIDERLTFGSGHLDSYGYFDKPCRICAAHHDTMVPEIIATIRKNMGDNADHYLDHAYWLTLAAWPEGEIDEADLQKTET